MSSEADRPYETTALFGSAEDALYWDMIWDKWGSLMFSSFVRLSLTPVFVVNPKVDVGQKGCGYENGSNLATINEEEKRSLQEQVAILSEDATLGDASEAKDDDLEAPSDLGQSSLKRDLWEKKRGTSCWKWNPCQGPRGHLSQAVRIEIIKTCELHFVHDGRIWKLKNRWSHARLVSIHIPSIRKILSFPNVSSFSRVHKDLVPKIFSQ